MKRFYYLITVAIILSLASCNKEEDPYADLKLGVATKGVSGVNNFGASLHGRIAPPDYIGEDFEFGFQCSLLESFPSYNTITVTADDYDKDKDFSCQVNEAYPSCTYYYRAYMLNQNEYYFGETKTFETDGFRLATGTLDENDYSVECKVTFDGETLRRIQYGVCFGTSESVSVMDDYILADTCIEGNYRVELERIPFGDMYYSAFVKMGEFIYYSKSKLAAGNVLSTGDFSTNQDFVNVHVALPKGYDGALCGICYGIEESPQIETSSVLTTLMYNDVDSYDITFPYYNVYGRLYYRSVVVMNGKPDYGDVKSMLVDSRVPVDLGLSVKWAAMNIGTDVSYMPGSYYAWAETVKKDHYGWNTYRYCEETDEELTKYNDDPAWGFNGYTDSKEVLDPSDDVAQVTWGHNWRMPTVSEYEELRTQCDWEYSAQHGQPGFFIHSRINGNVIFLPVTGYRSGQYLQDGSSGVYWTSTKGKASTAGAINFYRDNRTQLDRIFSTVFSRYVGLAVRAVSE